LTKKVKNTPKKTDMGVKEKLISGMKPKTKLEPFHKYTKTKLLKILSPNKRTNNFSHINDREKL